MKKLFYFISLLGLLASCQEEEPQEVLVVTIADLAGTWIYENAELGTVEVMKFTEDGDFYYTNDLNAVDFTDKTPGVFSMVNANASVLASYEGNKKTLYITDMKANTFVARDKNSGESTTYSRLISIVETSYNINITPSYENLIKGKIKSYRSHNDKTAIVDKWGTITGKAEGITLIDIATSEGTAVILVKVGGLIYDYTQAIGLTQEEVCATYGTALSATPEIVHYMTDEKMTTFKINKRTKLTDAIYIIYSKKNFSNSALIDYLNNKYYIYKAETNGHMYAYTNKSSYESSQVKITFDGSTNLTYLGLNHDLFEDFSIALDQTREQVVYMYGEELTPMIEQPSYIEYAIGDEIQGYAGPDVMDEVSFFFDNDKTFLVELSLSSHLKQESVIEFLKSKYTYSNGNGNHQYFYDRNKKLKVDYNAEDHKIRYNRDE